MAGFIRIVDTGGNVIPPVDAKMKVFMKQLYRCYKCKLFLDVHDTWLSFKFADVAGDYISIDNLYVCCKTCKDGYDRRN